MQLIQSRSTGSVHHRSDFGIEPALQTVLRTVRMSEQSAFSASDTVVD